MVVQVNHQVVGDVPIEYQLFTHAELQKSPHLSKIVGLINYAFRTQAEPLKPSYIRYEDETEFLETLGREGFMIVAFARVDDDDLPVAVTGASPWTRGGHFEPHRFGLTMKWHKQVVPQMRSEAEWEVISAAVRYSDDRFHRRGLVSECIKQIYEELNRRNEGKSITCVCVGMELSRDYWLKHGYSITDQVLAVCGSWGSSRDFMFYLLQKRIC